MMRLAYFFVFFLFLQACSDGGEKNTETITIRDTIYIEQKDTVFINQSDTVLIVEKDTVFIQQESNEVMLISVKHAEKATGNNPILTAAGTARADELAELLSGLNLSAVYSTDYNRTQLTAAPTAAEQGLEVELYDAFELEAFLETVYEEHKGEKILVVGHSNTAPVLVNIALGMETYPDLEETENGVVYLVETQSIGETEVVVLNYGD